jgi:hypothetical protein
MMETIQVGWNAENGLEGHSTEHHFKRHKGQIAFYRVGLAEFLNAIARLSWKDLGLKSEEGSMGVCLQFGEKNILPLILKAWH